MASWQFELHEPPQGDRALELWLQHATGRILFEDVRGYAIDQIDQTLSAEAQAAAKKGIDDALYGLMMVLDGVTGALANQTQRVEVAVHARLVNLNTEEIDVELDLKDGDGMCMGYHGWLEGDYGEDPVATRKP
ncbi:hypothetical protein [Roseateles sp. NT4]|uniref:hypothetical protein n=1 Tax=Roseateles sp. NT4 TaxID=3453715 RepID=UPI003F7177E6